MDNIKTNSYFLNKFASYMLVLKISVLNFVDKKFTLLFRFYIMFFLFPTHIKVRGYMLKKE